MNSSDVDDSSMELGIGNEEPCSMLGKRASVPHLKVDCRKHVGLYMPTPHQETEDRNQGPRRTSKSTCILVSFCSSLRQSPVSRRSDHRLGPYSSGGCGHRGGYCRKRWEWNMVSRVKCLFRGVLEGKSGASGLGKLERRIGYGVIRCDAGERAFLQDLRR